MKKDILGTWNFNYRNNFEKKKSYTTC